jgi:hypothetical protein
MNIRELLKAGFPVTPSCIRPRLSLKNRQEKTDLKNPQLVFMTTLLGLLSEQFWLYRGS